MSLIHGRDITAEELERIVGREFRIQRFASLCNAIVWATAKPRGLSQLLFTERVYVSDSGIDAEWVLDVGDDVQVQNHIGFGRNVFQSKQRDVTARDRNRIVGDLVRDLHGAIVDVVARTGRAVDRYVLLTNVDLTLDESRRLHDAISADHAGGVVANVIGASELSAALNNLPHIRSSFFATAEFATWSHARDAHVRAGITSKTPSLVGRQAIVGDVKNAIDDEAIGVVLVAGVSDIGKSRIVLASAEHRQMDSVFALDPVELKVSDILELKSADQPIVIVIEDLDINRVSELVAVALGEGLKLLLTVSSSRAAALGNYGRDPRVKLFIPSPLSEAESEELLRALEAKFDYNVRSWIIAQAGGNPGILVAAASIGEGLRVQGPTFRDQVGAGLEARAFVSVGEADVEILRLLSVMTGVGITADAAHELETLCRIFGKPTVNEIISRSKTLSQAGFLLVRGNYLEVVPPILANYFAQGALAGRSRELVELFHELPRESRVRLLRRIRQIKSTAVAALWDELFATCPLSNFDAALAEVVLLRLVTPAVPDRVAPLILRGLQERTIQQRSAIDGPSRRELAWALDQLLFYRSSSATALRALALLAEAENETWANNSTGVFAECFHPHHPQIPLPLQSRIMILRELLAGDPTRGRKLVVVKAIVAAFESHGAVSLRQSDGAEPFDPTPTFTYAELYAYCRELIGLAREIVRSATDQQLGLAAGEALIEGIGTFAAVKPDEGIVMLEEICPQVLDGNLPIALEKLVSTLQMTERRLEGQNHRFDTEVRRIGQLMETIEHGSFEIQIKRWIGSWEHGDQEPDGNGGTEFRSDREIRELAHQAVENPAILSDRLLAWLLSGEATESRIL